MADDDQVRALVKAGVPEEVARARVAEQYDPAERRETPAGGVFAVWPCNWLAVRAWSALRNCWRHHPMGGVLGLDHTQIPPTLSLMGIARREWGGLFEKLQVMEDEALGVLARR